MNSQLFALVLPNYPAKTREAMVRGRFAVVSAPSRGITIRARIPFHNGA